MHILLGEHIRLVHNEDEFFQNLLCEINRRFLTFNEDVFPPRDDRYIAAVLNDPKVRIVETKEDDGINAIERYTLFSNRVSVLINR